MGKAASGKPERGVGFGKLILFGEHAVVWGCPALVTGLGQGAVASLEPSASWSLRVMDREGAFLFEGRPDPLDTHPTSQALVALFKALGVDTPMSGQVQLFVPPGAGLGSSAALATAVARSAAVCFGLNAKKVEEAVAMSEGVFHGKASGIDQAAALRGGTFEFVRGGDGANKCQDVVFSESAWVAICQAEAGASTSRMVSGVGERRGRFPEVFEGVTVAMKALVAQAKGAMERGDWIKLGELMDLNHGLLCTMGVSTPQLDAACHVARQAGALGAKLTGAGGGGCVWALGADELSAEQIVKAWGAQGYSGWVSSIS